MSQSLKRKVFIFVLLCLLLLISVALLFYYFGSETNQLKRIIVSDLPNSLKAPNSVQTEKHSNNMESSLFWKNVDLKKNEIPSNIIESLSQIHITSKKIEVEGSEIFYLEVNPQQNENEITVVLLHGASFNSKTWQDLQTIQLMAALNYRAVAIDLPGFGKSPKSSLNSNDSKFLRILIEKLNLRKTVIISPSYSGYFSLPYLLEYWNQMAGYIPISPVGGQELSTYQCSHNIENARKSTSHFPQKLKSYLKEPFPNLDCLKTPTMIIYGDRDSNEIGLRNSALLGLMPLSQIVVIANAGHPAYLNDKHLWHQLLFNFLKLISEYEKQKTELSIN